MFPFLSLESTVQRSLFARWYNSSGQEPLSLTCGTFLNGLIHIGQKKIRAGRMGESGAEGITEFLVSLGFITGRLKTGTPPRLDRGTIDWNKTTLNQGDKEPTCLFRMKQKTLNHRTYLVILSLREPPVRSIIEEEP